ncbi:MAG: hypothetical protein ACN6I5_05540 [Hyphomicrobiales bacterium]
MPAWHAGGFVAWPVLRAPLVAALAFALALSLGDLGVIALFGSEQVQTMPYLIMQRMGAYRTQDAAGLALILMVMTMALMLAAEHFARRSRTMVTEGSKRGIEGPAGHMRRRCIPLRAGCGAHAVRLHVCATDDHRRDGSERLGQVDAFVADRRVRACRIGPHPDRRR